MDFLHCNFCGYIPHPLPHPQLPVRRMGLTTCMHVLCQDCVEHLKDTTLACKVCRVNCRIAEINSQLKPEVKMYFWDPNTVLRECLRKAQNVFEFQKSQQKRFQFLANQVSESDKKHSAEYEMLSLKMKAVVQHNVDLQKKVDDLTVYVGKLESGKGFGVGAGSIPDYESLLDENENLEFPALVSVKGRQGNSNNTEIPKTDLYTPLTFANVANGLKPSQGKPHNKTPASSSGRTRVATSSANTCKVVQGNLTPHENLSPSENEVPLRELERCASPKPFSMAPGAERRPGPSFTPQVYFQEDMRPIRYHSPFEYEATIVCQGTPDILARLRQLRC